MTPAITTARELRRRGDPRWRLETAVRAGGVMRLRRGIYIPQRVWSELSPRSRMLLRMDAELASARGPRVFSHESAAAAWGLPIVGPWPGSVQLTAPVGDTHRSNRVARWHLSALPDDDVEVRDGYSVTSRVRTVVDLAATRDLASGVAAFDAILRDDASEATSIALAELIARRRPFWGVRKAEAASRVATGRSESVLESISLARFHELELPAPQQQVEFRVDGATYRVDFYWPGFDVIGEADGRAKYDQAPASVLWEEKRREDALRSRCCGFARWTWADAMPGGVLPDRLRRAGVLPTPR